jgi:hypothetical protein
LQRDSIQVRNLDQLVANPEREDWVSQRRKVDYQRFGEATQRNLMEYQRLAG